MSPYVYAIPVFMLLIGIEVIATVIRKKDFYRLNDSINSLSAGMIYVTSAQLINFGIYTFVFHHFAVFNLDTNALWVWVVAFVLKDFFYYWFHRYSHEINVLWASHSVHHQSEEYNLTTALRQPSTGFLLGWIFYVPMALLGIPPLVYVVVSLANLLYQFWVHTRHVGKLGWFDRTFASPSNHRVHHAKNRRYLDKNYGGVFMVWDRMFGTFENEDDDYEAIKYGTLKPVRSWNPIWANLHLYVSMFKDAVKTNRLYDKLALWFKKTGYRPRDVAKPMKMPDIFAYQNFDPSVSQSNKIYIAIQFALLAIVSNVLVGLYNLIPYWQSVYWFILLAVNLMFIGWMLENEDRIVRYEITRTVSTFICAILAYLIWSSLPSMLLLATGIWTVLSLVVLACIKNKGIKLREINNES